MTFSMFETRYDKEEKIMAVWIDYINIPDFLETLNVELCESADDFELAFCRESLYINMWEYEGGNYRNWIKDLSKVNKALKEAENA